MHRHRAPLRVWVQNLVVWGLLLVLATAAHAQSSARAKPASPERLRVQQEETPVIELVTMGPGAHFTERFGHAAVCVRYPQSPRFDLCYNYGTTNFQDPAGMAWDFVRGRSKFWVSTQRPQVMLDLYVYRDRNVWIQQLPLPTEQARSIAADLVTVALEENKYYKYHHFYDNCATRIRDLLDKNTDGALQKNSGSSLGVTFRELAREGFAPSPALVVASDYVLGRIGGETPTEYQAMFLPKILQEAARQRYGAEPVQIYERKGPGFRSDPGLVRIWVFLGSLLLVAPLWWLYAKKKSATLVMVPAVLGLFLGGLVIWGLAVLSPLPMARYNENLLLFFPGDLALLFLSAVKRQRYAQVRVVIVLLAAALALVGILRQPLWIVGAFPALALLPLALDRSKGKVDPEKNSDEP